MAYYVYILKCADNSYYTGSTNDLSNRIWEHQEGMNPVAYTYHRRPVVLLWSEEVATYSEALMHEHQIKGWSRLKKEALVCGDFEAIHEIVRQERKRREKERQKSSKLRPERSDPESACTPKRCRRGAKSKGA